MSDSDTLSTQMKLYYDKVDHKNTLFEQMLLPVKYQPSEWKNASKPLLVSLCLLEVTSEVRQRRWSELNIFLKLCTVAPT